jgi:transitional endoplasmic reticulum ATPase
MYYLLFGMPPWFKDISNYQAERAKVEDIILEGRKKPLAFPNIADDIVDFNQSILTILKKALNNDVDNRFQSANEFIQALKGEIEIPKEFEKQSGENKSKVEKKRFSPESKFKGFNAIAGMQELKDKLYNDVIDLLNDKEGAERYSLSIPNGMLLYGPPGCGKTFFAEKFAEETGYNYKYIRSSDLASIYIHGSQGKIGELFKDARENAPIILCFDELDALVPDRNSVNNASQSGEVNEFLSQLNNCGDDGIFIIGTTNKPNLIDSAVLRAGRIDIKIYVPLPDQESRKALFKLYLKDKPLDFGIDYDKLASLTENYIVSDLVKIVRESGSTVRKSRGRITMEVLEKIIQKTEPSVSLDEIKKHEAIRDKFNSNKNAKTNERRKVGY